MTYPGCCVCAVCTASRTPNAVDTRFLPEIREEENSSYKRKCKCSHLRYFFRTTVFYFIE